MIGTPRRICRVATRALLNRYRDRKRASAKVDLPHAMETVEVMLHSATYCFLVTGGAAASMSARLVQPIVDESAPLRLWFGTDPTSRKARDIAQDPRVLVTVEDRREHAGLVLYGTARLERDPTLRLRRWRPEWEMFFPAGPTSDSYVAIRFDADRLELMNFRRGVVPEPFGLRPLVMVRQGTTWELDPG